MNIAIFNANIRKLVTQRNIFLFFSSMLSIALILLVTLLFHKSERIIVVPTSGGSYWIDEGDVSEGYLEGMGVFLSDLLLNRSPSDVEWKNAKVLKHVHPAFYHDVKKILTSEARELSKQDQSFLFKPERSFTDNKTKSFVLEGEGMTFVYTSGNQVSCAQRSKKQYILGFKCENGRLLLVSLKQKEI